MPFNGVLKARILNWFAIPFFSGPHFVRTRNAEEAEVERFYEDLQDLLELTPKKDVLFIIGNWNAK